MAQAAHVGFAIAQAVQVVVVLVLPKHATTAACICATVHTDCCATLA